MWFALFSVAASLAAQPAPSTAASVNAAVTAGVTAAQIAAATSPIPLLTFTYQKVSWTVACRGTASALSCTATAGASKATGKGSSATSILLNLGGNEIDVKAAGTPVSLLQALVTNE